MPRRHSYFDRSGSVEFVVAENSPAPSSQYSDTYRDDGDSESARIPDHTDEIREALSRLTGRELRAYKQARFASNLPVNDIHALVHQVFSFERENGMDPATLAKLQAEAMLIIVSTRADVLRAHVDNTITMPSAPHGYLKKAFTSAAEADQPIIYRLSLCDANGLPPNPTDISILVAKLSNYQGEKQHVVDMFVRGLRRNNMKPRFCCVGFTNNPTTRRADHLRRSNSNWLMGLVQDVFESEASTRQRFVRRFQVLLRIFERSQAAVGEHLFSRLAQCSVSFGGFQQYPAGRSVEGIESISGEAWRTFAEEALEGEHSVLEQQSKRWL